MNEADGRRTDWKEVDCVLCRVPSTRIVIREDGCTCKQCPNCGLIYVSPRPQESEIEQTYAEGDDFLESYPAQSYWHVLHAMHNLRIVRRYSRPGRILELGSGGGHFLSEAKRRGYRPVGIELNKSRAKRIREEVGVPCEESPLSSASFPGESFDVLYHCDTISHLSNPIEQFQMMRSRLAPGGVMVFETGNLGDVDARYYREYESFLLPEHLFSFGIPSLRKLLDQTGFRLVRIHAYNQLPFLRVYRRLKAFADRLRRPSTGRRVDGVRTSASSSIISSIGSSPLLRAAATMAYSALYVLRYPLGSIAPKRGRPQTLVVVARRTPD